MKTLGPRTREASLVVCLVLLAAAVAIESQRLVPPIFTVKVRPVVVHGSGSGTTPGFKSRAGTLVIEATSDLRFPAVTFPLPYLPDVGVSVVPVGVGPLYPTVYRTNSSGGLTLMVSPANYSVSFYDLPLNVSVPVTVHENDTTTLQLRVTGNTYAAMFLDVAANGTDVARAWTPGTLELGTTIPLSGDSAVFLDLYYNSTSAAAGTGQLQLKSPVQVPVLVTGTEVRSSAAVSAQWISFQPETAVSLEGLTSVGISVYEVSAGVAMVAPPSGQGGNITAD